MSGACSDGSWSDLSCVAAAEGGYGEQGVQQHQHVALAAFQFHHDGAAEQHGGQGE